MVEVNDKVSEKPQGHHYTSKHVSIMSDKTQVFPDSIQPQTPAVDEVSNLETNSDKKSTSKKVAAIGAGIAGGVGAIAWDTYGAEVSAEIEEEVNPTPTDTSEENSQPTTPSDSTSTDTVPQTPTEPQQPADSTHTNANIHVVPDHLAIANMPDSMSFNEAFDAARQSMGSGALFEWRGELYHTCHPDEYAALPQEMKNLFADAWTAHESHTDGVEVVPEEEGVAYVFDLNSSSNGTDHPTDNSDNIPGDDSNTPTDDYTAYTDTNPVDADYDNNYDGADDFINPEDMVA